MNRLVVTAVIIAGPGLLGCSLAAILKSDRVSFTDRCAEIMRTAMPAANIDIDKATAVNAGIRTITARIEGTRTDGAKDLPVDRALAVECRFDDNVLTAFHWTKGGPPPASSPR